MVTDFVVGGIGSPCSSTGKDVKLKSRGHGSDAALVGGTGGRISRELSHQSFDINCKLYWNNFK